MNHILTGERNKPSMQDGDTNMTVEIQDKVFFDEILPRIILFFKANY